MTITRDPIRDMHQAMGIKDSLKDIGAELADHSKQEFAAERSSLEELFPYIMIASEKMSARAISRWFKDEKMIPISAASVSKAIREQGRYCGLIYKRALVGANWLAHEFALDADDILTNRDLVRGEKIGTPYNQWMTGSQEEQSKAREIYKNGLSLLDEWDGLPDEIRNLCIEKCINNKPKGENEK